MSNYGIELSREELSKVDELCDRIRKRVEKDPMTPRERFDLVMQGKEPDRIPIQVCAIGLHSAAFSGVTPKDLYTNPKVSLMAYLSHLERFGYDTPSAFRFSLGEAEFGGQVFWGDVGVPFTVKGSVKSLEDVSKLRIPDPRKDGSLPWMLWMISLLKEKLGDIMPIYGFLNMPGGSASCLGTRTMEEALLDMRENPELAHALGEVALKFSILYGRAQIEAGADALHLVGTENLISAKMSREFSVPLLGKLVSSVSRPCFIIGSDDWSHVLEDIAKTGVEGFHLFSGQPLETEKAICKKYNLVLRYGVSSRALLDGPPEAIEKEVREVLKRGSPGVRFILTTDALDFNTPNSNLDVFMKAAKECGKLPLKF